MGCASSGNGSILNFFLIIDSRFDRKDGGVTRISSAGIQAKPVVRLRIVADQQGHHTFCDESMMWADLVCVEYVNSG
jgi:hypothetical protein